MNGSDWRRHFTDYEAALAADDRAQGLVAQLQARMNAGATDFERAAINAGIAVARRRAHRTAHSLALATVAFAQGRSVLEAVWSAPDDI